MKADLNGDSSENVNYDRPEIPVYIRKGGLAAFKDFAFDSHWHTDLEFVTVKEGHMLFNVNGTVLPLHEGEGIFINSGNTHFGFSADGSDCVYMCLLVHPIIFCQNPFIEKSFILPIINSVSHPYILLEKGNAAAERIAADIEAAYEQRAAAHESYCLDLQSKLFDIIARLYELVKTAPESSVPQYDFGRIKLMLDFIEKNYERPVTLADIAGSANISSSLCQKLFRRFTGRSPVAYLIKYRLEKGAHLLTSTQKTITEIAYTVGFSGASYFTEAFVKFIGCTPSEYRKAHGR